MKHIFREKLYQGTRTEIMDQMTIDLRDLLGFGPNEIQQELFKIPKVFEIEIGIDVFSGTKREILDQFIVVQKIAQIVCVSFSTLSILGITVFMKSGEHVDVARDKVIKGVKRIINDF